MCRTLAWKSASLAIHTLSHVLLVPHRPQQSGHLVALFCSNPLRRRNCLNSGKRRLQAIEDVIRLQGLGGVYEHVTGSKSLFSIPIVGIEGKGLPAVYPFPCVYT